MLCDIKKNILHPVRLCSGSKWKKRKKKTCQDLCMQADPWEKETEVEMFLNGKWPVCV